MVDHRPPCLSDLDNLELCRRIGFALGQINEAMGELADAQKDDARYWAMKKALERARDFLKEGDCRV